MYEFNALIKVNYLSTATIIYLLSDRLYGLCFVLHKTIKLKDFLKYVKLLFSSLYFIINYNTKVFLFNSVYCGFIHFEQ